MPLPSDFIERLKAANPIVDIMGMYIDLKRTGRDYICKCPFHPDSTPSCHVHPEKEYFHCFGCGAGGDVITFVMKYQNLDYWESVKYLAERAGIPLPEADGSYKERSDERKRIYEMNRKAARFFYEQLKSPQGRACREYLAKRGLSPETVKKYGMGFAPQSYKALKDYMMSEGYSEKELERASLISRSQTNTKNTFDFFVFRAMFPFIDLRGNIVGFGGRALSPDDKRKYLNSKDTPAYNKNKFLFSMCFAKDASVKSRKILLCEGNLDVISLNQSGFDNAVASCGTALTQDQVKLISNYADEVVICYDSDEAGQKAALRAIPLIRSQGLKASVVRIPDAKDPDEFIVRFGRGKFEYLLNNAVDSVTYELETAASGNDLDSDTGKADYLIKACGIISGLRSPIERDIYISKLAKEQGVAKKALEEQIDTMLRREYYAKQKKQREQALGFAARRDPLNPDAVLHPRENTAEQQIIYYIYTFPDKCGYVNSRLPADKFVTELNARIYSVLSARILSGEDFSLSSFYDEFSPEQVDRISSIIADNADKGIDAAVADDCIDILLRYVPAGSIDDQGVPTDEDIDAKIRKLRENN
ncbi:MAG: DNA primase [Ruminococcus sp.]|nr:DNA primase [Ruminococcus sp.]